MNTMIALRNDENGFVISAELILVATILVIGLITGLAELSYNVNQELEDVGSAIGSINQSYGYTMSTGHKGNVFGSSFVDNHDHCDSEADVHCAARPERESQG